MTNFYSYADVNPESVSAVIELVPSFSGGYTKAPEDLGFFLVSGTLVPKHFLHALHSQLSDKRLTALRSRV
jgi:hypothetical protein